MDTVQHGIICKDSGWGGGSDVQHKRCMLMSTKEKYQRLKEATADTRTAFSSAIRNSNSHHFDFLLVMMACVFPCHQPLDRLLILWKGGHGILTCTKIIVHAAFMRHVWVCMSADLEELTNSSHPVLIGRQTHRGCFHWITNVACYLPRYAPC